MAHISTVRLLRDWARWGQAQSIDYPTMSPMFGERALKTPLYGVGHLPEGVAEVEKAVCELQWFHRDVLVARYQRHLSWAKIALRIGKSWRTARRAVIEAEDLIEKALRDGHQSVRKASDSKAVTMPREGAFSFGKA